MAKVTGPDGIPVLALNFKVAKGEASSAMEKGVPLYAPTTVRRVMLVLEIGSAVKSKL